MLNINHTHLAEEEIIATQDAVGCFEGVDA